MQCLDGGLAAPGTGTWEQDATLCQEAGTLAKEAQVCMAQELCTPARAHSARSPQPCSTRREWAPESSHKNCQRPEGWQNQNKTKAITGGITSPAKIESRRKTGSFPEKLAKQPAVRREIFAGAEPTTKQPEQPVCRSPCWASLRTQPAARMMLAQQCRTADIKSHQRLPNSSQK